MSCLRLCVAALIAASIACHHTRIAPVLPPTVEEHCWWTYLSTTLPVAEVSARYARGFTREGFVPVRQESLGDTAWVVAGPAPLETHSGRASWTSRMVAYRAGDSTRFRVFVGVGPRFAHWAAPDDSAAADSDRIPMCGRVLGAAGVAGLRSSRGPNALDSLAVWRRGALR